LKSFTLSTSSTAMKKEKKAPKRSTPKPEMIKLDSSKEMSREESIVRYSI